MFRAFKKSSLESLSLQENGNSVMFEMTFVALASGLKLFECPTTERPIVGSSRRQSSILSAISFLRICLKYPFMSATYKKRAARRYVSN